MLLPLLALLLLPLLGGVLEALSLSRRGWAALAVGGLAVLAAAWLVLQHHTQPGVQAPLQQFAFAVPGGLMLNWGFSTDALSVHMALLVAVVGFAVAAWHMARMRQHPHWNRFALTMGLFGSGMQVLVLSDNVWQLFLGWEWIGLCSFLLIGFERHRRPHALAASRAFLTNRLGDAALLAGLFIYWHLALNPTWTGLYSAVQHSRVEDGSWTLGLQLGVGTARTGMPAWALPLASALVLLGCWTKAGQWPLGGWLPQAMLGPTGVSALLHAATLVAAGAYLVLRMAPVLDVRVLWGATLLALVSSLRAGLLAGRHTHLKRVLAHSTASQLGLVLLLALLLQPAAATQLLLVHGVLKAGLFLAVGAVAHEVLSPRQGYHTGGGLGLWQRHRPLAVAVALLLAGLAGLPLWGSFPAKAQLLATAMAQPGAWGPWAWGLVALLWALYAITVFYSLRLGLVLLLPAGGTPRAVRPSCWLWAPVLGLAVLALGAVWNLNPLQLGWAAESVWTVTLAPGLHTPPMAPGPQGNLLLVLEGTALLAGALLAVGLWQRQRLWQPGIWQPQGLGAQWPERPLMAATGAVQAAVLRTEAALLGLPQAIGRGFAQTHPPGKGRSLAVAVARFDAHILSPLLQAPAFLLKSLGYLLRQLQRGGVQRLLWLALLLVLLLVAVRMLLAP